MNPVQVARRAKPANLFHGQRRQPQLSDLNVRHPMERNPLLPPTHSSNRDLHSPQYGPAELQDVWNTTQRPVTLVPPLLETERGLNAGAVGRPVISLAHRRSPEHMQHPTR